jgi:rare lipoprotein A
MSKVTNFVIIGALIFLGGCSTRGLKTYQNSDSQSSTKEKKHFHSNLKMNPYTVRGVRYYPTMVSVGDEFEGRASWYGPSFHTRLTANGETYDMHGMTAAHKTLPMNTIVRVTNHNNNLSTVVRINDRGPFVGTRIIDLSKAAAKEISMIGTGTAPVTLEILGFETANKKIIPTKKELNKLPQKSPMTNFALQIASFTKIEGAIRTQEKYDNTDGYKTVIKDVENEDGRVFKILLKGFKSQQEARDYKKNSNFENSFIVRED